MTAGLLRAGRHIFGRDPATPPKGAMCEKTAPFSSDALLRGPSATPTASSCINRDVRGHHRAQAGGGAAETYQERLRSLASQLALAEERERRRIATALHDEVGQALALARIKLGELADASPRKEFTARVLTVYEMIAQVLKRTRSLTFELSPPVLYELGFGEAVAWLVEEFQKQHPIRWEFRGERLRRRWPTTSASRCSRACARCSSTSSSTRARKP